MRQRVPYKLRISCGNVAHDSKRGGEVLNLACVVFEHNARGSGAAVEDVHHICCRCLSNAQGFHGFNQAFLALAFLQYFFLSLADFRQRQRSLVTWVH